MKTELNLRIFLPLAILFCAGQLQVSAYVAPPGPPANPPPFLDQSQSLWGSTANMGWVPSIAQTFTPSITGSLSRIDLAACENYPMEQDTLLVSIYTTLNGVPKTSLGSFSLTHINPNPIVMDWYSLDTSKPSVSLTAGQTYAIVMTCNDFNGFEGLSLEGTVEDSYAGGTCLVQVGDNTWEPYLRTQDIAFQTWMTPVPEPSQPILLVLGLVFLFRR